MTRFVLLLAVLLAIILPTVAYADTTAATTSITVPVVVLRGGKSDLHHTRETSELVHRMIPGSELREPPWGDQEWNDAMERSARDGSLFKRWPLLAPDIIGFAKGL